MTLDDALTIVIARTGHEHYRQLTSEANPNIAQRDGYRASVLRQAGAPEPPPATPTEFTHTGDPCCGGDPYPPME